MSQQNPVVPNQSGAGYREDANNARKALASHHKDSAEPSYKEAGMIWVDDTATPWLMKFYDGADWIVLGSINATTNEFTPYIGGAALVNVSKSDVNAWSKIQHQTVSTLTFDATQDWNVSEKPFAKLTLTANTIFDEPTGIVAGGVYVIYLIQDATGNRTAGFNSVFNFKSGEAPVLSTAANSVDMLVLTSADGVSLETIFHGDFS